MTAAWQSVKNELMAASGRDFENLVFPWLKLRHPLLAHPTGLKDLDKKGVDMCYVIPGQKFPVVVQCKGFEVTVDALGDGQVAQVGASVRTFIQSKLTCECYILLYNRGGNNRDFAQKADSELDALRQGGFADQALLWSVDDLLKALEQSLSRQMLEALSLWSERMDRQRRGLFSFDDVVIDDVPVRRRRWSHGPGVAKGALTLDEPITIEQMRQDLFARGEKRWSLLIGAYGMGKTTLMRHVALPPGYKRILVPASVLLHVDLGGGSENALMEHILRHSGCLQALADQSGLSLKQLERLGGTGLAAAFRSHDEKLVLIIDGLDENRVYARADGFRLLANELGKVRIPVVLTTRKEHFLNSYLDLQPREQKVWVSQSIETAVLELSEWSALTCTAMLQRVAAQSQANAGALAPLMDLLNRNALPLVTAHPLWLAMAIDLALSGHASLFSTPYQLYEDWTHRKFLRDMDAAGRELPPAVDARGIFAQTMSQLMLEVAVALCEVQEGRLELREEVPEDQVVQLARALIPSAGRLDPLIAQTSLLMPTSIRTAGGVQLRFSHYSFQEFYTAQAIAQGKVKSEGLSLPQGVQAFMRG